MTVVTEERTCECGCGKPVKPGNRFVHAGHWRTMQARERLPAPPKKRPLCACGCGSRTAGGEYKRGHSTRSRSRRGKGLNEPSNYAMAQKAEELAQPCIVRCARCDWSAVSTGGDACEAFRLHPCTARETA